MQPSHAGVPGPIKDSLGDRFASYASYKFQLEALMPREELHYACVPGMDVETVLHPLDEGMLWSCMGMQQVRTAKYQEKAQGAGRRCERSP